MPASKSQKGRKIGRNSEKCKQYRARDQQAKNAVKRRIRADKRAQKLVLYGVRKAARTMGIVR